MTQVAIRGLWKGVPVSKVVEMGLLQDLSDQQKQIAGLAWEDAAPDAKDSGTPGKSGVEESAVDFAMRLGFTKLDYYYEENGREIVVDIMDPSRAV